MSPRIILELPGASAPRPKAHLLEFSDLALVLVTLVAASVLAGRLRLSAIPVFIVAGILLGPSPGFPTVIEASAGTDLLARLGIVLLLFFLGLEFSLDRILAARRLVLVGGAIDLALNGGLGLAVGVILLGPVPEAVLLGGLVYVRAAAS